MERNEILEAMSELKLYGMRASFDEIAGKGLARRDEIYPLIASLIRAERTHRQARSISYRIGGAKFPVLKDLDKFVFADTSIDEGQVRELAAGTFLDAKRNAIFIGGTECDSYCSSLDLLKTPTLSDADCRTTDAEVGGPELLG
jgi:IstB-like ATP binding protein